MKFDPPLEAGRLLQRYKRFLSDIRLEDGREITAHCANPGSMLGLKEPGMRVWVQPATNPKRKLQWSWRLVELPNDHWAGIDTGIPNIVAGEALRAGKIATLEAYENIRPEVKYGVSSRVDFLLSSDGLPDAYVEVKNVHYCATEGLAEFPDSVTARGAKHLVELTQMVRQGHRAIMLYIVQRTDCSSMSLADTLDPNYAEAFDKAYEAGVEVLVYDTAISPQGVFVRDHLKFNR